MGRTLSLEKTGRPCNAFSRMFGRIGHAVRICWLQTHPQYRDHYEECVSLAWQAFYQLPPHAVANGILDALVHLLNHKYD